MKNNFYSLEITKQGKPFSRSKHRQTNKKIIPTQDNFDRKNSEETLSKKNVSGFISGFYIYIYIYLFIYFYIKDFLQTPKRFLRNNIYVKKKSLF